MKVQWESSADFVLFEGCGFYRRESLKAADLQKTQVCYLRRIWHLREGVSTESDRAEGKHLTNGWPGHRLKATWLQPQKNVSPLVVPSAIRRKAGFKDGDKLEFKAAGGVITISRKLPVASDEYTPAQRRIIDARLTEAPKGPYHGPFETAEEVIRFIRKEIRNRKAQTSWFSKSAAFPTVNL